jgi:oxygen-independent coproporphyrinogen-3 oxidase
MRLLDSPARDDLSRAVASHTEADYVYMYPPRQAYRPVDGAVLEKRIDSSLRQARSLDLYLHFPFCRQICSFCNLYAVVSTNPDVFSDYVDVLLQECRAYAPLLHGKTVDTLYLGGGTPSQIEPPLFERLFEKLQSEYGFSVAEVEEVALEVAPDTVTDGRMKGYVDAGINRVNLGVQSAADAELHGIGRRHGAELSLGAVETALAAGFRNVCVDLIYGLEGQNFDSWRRSVDAVVGLDPPTVCAYPLTLRPWTGFSARGYNAIDRPEQLAKYEYVDSALQAAGYRQETHVRWAKGPHGGYLQKENHWTMGSMVGLGAGARSYLWEVDYRNGYSARHRVRVLREWRRDVLARGHGRIDGFLMSEDERRRKAIVLGLHHLDLAGFEQVFGQSPLSLFSREFDQLVEGGFGVLEGSRFRLTSEGMAHRDILVQPFISERVRRLCEDLDYGG